MRTGTKKKKIQDQRRVGGKRDPLGILQVIKIWPYEQMVEAQIRIRPRKLDA